MRSVDLVQQPFPGLETTAVLRCHFEAPLERFPRLPGYVRSEYNLLQSQDRVGWGNRLRSEHVEARSCNPFGAERIYQRRLVYELASSGIDQDGS